MLVIYAATPSEVQQQIIKYLDICAQDALQAYHRNKDRPGQKREAQLDWARYSALKLAVDSLRDAYVGPDPIRALDGR